MDGVSSCCSVKDEQSEDEMSEVVGDVLLLTEEQSDSDDGDEVVVDGASLEFLSNLANTVQSVYDSLQVGCSRFVQKFFLFIVVPFLNVGSVYNDVRHHVDRLYSSSAPSS